MKIERLSENQIRCTLYKADLADKELLLTELAYGTDKAKELFRELMQQASNELGFEVDNIPLMIEAIPVNQECLVLIITKVDDPEELDTRFSRFTRPVGATEYEESDDDDEQSADMVQNKAADGLIEALGNLADGLSALGNSRIPNNLRASSKQQVSAKEVFRIYAFKTLDQVILSAKLVNNIYGSDNTLYKNPKDSKFYLYMTKNNNSDGEFVRTCNLISEYGSKIRTTYATPSYMREHYKLIIDANALQTLAEL